MTTEKKEYLSALVDDELHGHAMHNTLDALLRDPELHRSWGHYHAMREAMHGQSDLMLGERLQQRLKRALAEEPTVLAPRRRVSQGWLRHVAGVAVAASVTGMAIIGIQHINQAGGAATTLPAMASNQPAPEQYARMETPVAVATGERARSDHLAPYLVNHNEYSSSTNMQGMLPYVRIVGHGSQR